MNTDHLRELLAKATPGPWRWDVNLKCRSASLVGARGYFVMDFARWGMSCAQPVFPGNNDGFIIMHKLSERHDWIAPIEGREHHAHWHATIDHSNANLMVAAVNALPDLLAEIDRLTGELAEARRDAGWQPIDTAPKDRHIIGWGTIVGRHICYHDGRQWQKCERGASFQLGPAAITHWMPLPPPPAIDAAVAAGGGVKE